MRYVYQAILYPDDGAVGVTVPDLPGCHTFGKDKAEALLMAKDAIEMWLWYAEDNGQPIPPASESIVIESEQTATLIVADTDAYRRANDNRAVKKTLTIPAWLNAEAEKAHVNFSGLLQSALKEHLGIESK
ncbi:MAG: type II toxin-antitoxin system HicB family antitoxin [Oscillospiraceae bacterium]|nr:type II toxin-antitoxin system HicB family antitoxin [Oscillospiraceae bacterium]